MLTQGVAYRIDLQAFIKLESKDYGIIVRCRLSERAALGFVLEPLLVSLKAQYQYWHMMPIVRQWRVHRPDINISACNAEQLAARLLYFDSIEAYCAMKYVINRARSIVVEAFDLGNISPAQAVDLADLSYGEQVNALQELLVKRKVA